jgi:hypothetical protein
MSVTEYVPRAEKAGWGFPCNQKVDGSLWAGKGFECPLEEQFEDEVVAAILQALEDTRGNRGGRFWVNLKTRTVTMMVGDGLSNKQKKARF